MGVRVSKGSGTVTLTFVPQGFIEGLIAFSLESFSFPLRMETNKKTEKAKESNHRSLINKRLG